MRSINLFSHLSIVQWLKVTALAVVVLTSSSTFAADMARSGTFTGLSNHVTTGTASIVKEDSGYFIVLGDDFTFDGAPDPKVALGKDGKYDPSTLIELLRSNSGAQKYAVPASIDVSEFNEVYIWCEKYSVGLGVAALN